MKTNILRSGMIALWLILAYQVGSAAEIATRSKNYIDDTRDNYFSGWKALITNAYPTDVLESGRWFHPSPTPKAFAEGNIKPFSIELRAKLRNNSTDGLIVVKDDAIVGQYFRYGFGSDDIHLVQSTGKVFTSFAIQPVYDRIGTKGLNQSLSSYLPKLKGKFFGEATLAQTLDMKNGMEWTENYEDPTTATMLSGPVAGWDPIDPKKGAESWYERMFDFPKYGDHGKTWVYNNSSVIAASLAAAAIDERPFSELVQDSYNTLGFEDRSWYVSNAFNELSAEGGQAMSIRDHAKLGRFMLKTSDSAYVDDVWDMIGDKNDQAVMVFLKKYPFAKAYKNYWYKLDDNVILALGSSGQFLYVDRSKNLIISKFSSYVEGQGLGEFAEGFSIIAEIAALY
ncbi:MAG: serine hydrolase [Gammaproteobacteria bacterium]|nr:serine hydrolase [Gammaproteobacteria bacterium]